MHYIWTQCAYWIFASKSHQNSILNNNLIQVIIPKYSGESGEGKGHFQIKYSHLFPKAYESYKLWKRRTDTIFCPNIANIFSSSNFREQLFLSFFWIKICKVSHFSKLQVRYTLYRDRPAHERQAKFQSGCRDGHTEIVRKYKSKDTQIHGSPQIAKLQS